MIWRDEVQHHAVTPAMVHMTSDSVNRTYSTAIGPLTLRTDPRPCRIMRCMAANSLL